jgi:acetylornithine deacetylase
LNTHLTRAESDTLAAVDEAAIATTLLELLAIPSVTGTAAESQAQHWLARRLRGLGLDVDLWSMDLPALQGDADFPGFEAPRDEAWGLVGVTGEGDGPTVILQGHVDVVPPGDLARWRAIRSRPGPSAASCMVGARAT